ncbi:regulator of G-protein signaling 16 isoform X1 [Tamandua tetradactyla]|uniref:regulator of G-protein signaling 16 isoform X1 n=1 Tax=Tamandua tetradactyla TaxID=48850 RepID=UPI00405440FD
MCRTLSAFPTTCLERAKEFKTRLGIFLHKSELGSDTGNMVKFEPGSKHSKESRNFSEDVLGWRESFDLLLSSKNGVAAFHAFLKTEFSEENLEFWLACEEFKKIRSAAKLTSRAQRIFEEFVRREAPKEVRAPPYPMDPTDPVCSFPTEDWGLWGPGGEGLGLEVDWSYLAEGGVGFCVGRPAMTGSLLPSVVVYLRRTMGQSGLEDVWASVHTRLCKPSPQQRVSMLAQQGDLVVTGLLGNRAWSPGGPA